MKVYILTDMEGVSGIIDFELQCFPKSPAFRQAQELLTGEVNAAVQGAVDAGAETVVVEDAHILGLNNILFDQLHPAAELVQGTIRPHWFPSIEEGFDAFVELGAHAMAGTPNAVLCHTMEDDIISITLNGQRIGEVGMAAAGVGSRGMPTVMVSGDQAAVAEMQALVPQVEGVVVKKGLSRYLARSLSPARARENIQTGMKNALKRLGEIPPYVVSPPYVLRVTYVTPRAEYLSRTTDLQTRVVSATTIEYTAENILKLYEIYQ